MYMRTDVDAWHLLGVELPNHSPIQDSDRTVHSD